MVDINVDLAQGVSPRLTPKQGPIIKNDDRVFGDKTVRFNFIASQYTPAADIQITANIDEAKRPLVFYFEPGNYSPSSDFSPRQNMQDVFNRRQPAEQKQDINFEFQPRISLDVDQSRTKRNSTNNVFIEFNTLTYTPKPEFVFRQDPPDLFRFELSNYTPTTHFFIPNITDVSISEAPIKRCTIAGSVGDISGIITADIITSNVKIFGVIGALSGSLSAEYDVNVPRYKTGNLTARYEDTAGISNFVRSAVNQSFTYGGNVKSNQQAAIHIYHGRSAAADNSNLIQVDTLLNVDNATILSNDTIISDGQNKFESIQKCGTLADASGLYTDNTAHNDILYFKQKSMRSSMADCGSEQLRHQRSRYFQTEPQPEYQPSADLILQPPSSSGETRILRQRLTQSPNLKPELALIGDDITFSRTTRSRPTFVMDYVPLTGPSIVGITPEVAGVHSIKSTIESTISKVRYEYSPQFHDDAPEITVDQRNLIIADHDLHFVYAGKTVFLPHAVTADIKGMLHTNPLMPLQNGTWYCKKHLLPYQDGMKPLPGKSPWIDIPRPPPDPTAPNGSTHTIPSKKAYTMLNTITVKLADDTDISVDDITLDFDADSHTWLFEAALLDATQKDLLKPDINGEPVMLNVIINSVTWLIVVETSDEERSFNKRNIKVKGVGVSALLNSPYLAKTTGLQGSDLTVAQLLETHLPFGWSLTHDHADWLVPGNAYGWQNRSPLQAISDIAQMIGAMVIPARDSQSLTIKSRYPVLPWNFSQVSPDYVIPDTVILGMSYRQPSGQYPNGVYVHGGEVGGQIGFCRLNGSAGDVLIETQNNSLMTDPTGLRALGERLLAGEYPQPEISRIKIPMDGNTIPAIEVGDFIQVNDGANQIRSIVSGVKINATRKKTTQTLILGEDSGNRWQAFTRLLPADPLLIGTVSSVAGNISTVTLLGGGIMTVRGAGTIGQAYYLRSGQIQDEAPNMNQNTIVI